jgi:hypothetical protein
MAALVEYPADLLGGRIGDRKVRHGLSPENGGSRKR